MPLLHTDAEDNTSNLRAKDSNGIKVAKAGFDALTAADKDLLFSSSWPMLQIVKVITIDGTTDKYPHELPYPTIAMVLDNNAGTTFPMELKDTDETNIYVDTVLDLNKTLVIYNIDITTDVEYPFTAGEVSPVPYDSDYGFKIVKPSGSIDSTDMRDYLVHSRCGSPLILAVKTQETVNDANPNLVQYTNTIGYATFNFGFVRVPPTSAIAVSIGFTGQLCYVFAPLGGQAQPLSYSTGTTSQVPTNQVDGDGGSLVILRNPYFVTTNTESVTV